MIYQLECPEGRPSARPPKYLDSATNLLNYERNDEADLGYTPKYFARFDRGHLTEEKGRGFIFIFSTSGEVKCIFTIKRHLIFGSLYISDIVQAPGCLNLVSHFRRAICDSFMAPIVISH